jgi:D-alanyl-D-alanine dipeptidase
MKWDRTKGRPEPIRALNRILERDNGERLVDMRVACPSVRVLRPGALPWCREKVADMAEHAAGSLPHGVYLGFVEAWRPWVRQKRIYDWMWRKLEEARPGLSHAAMRRTVCRWVAPVDQKAPPGHCTGAALDVYLVDALDEPLDVISPFNRFEAAPTYTFGLSKTAETNRALLVKTMLDAGFSNCRDEFWHYSYGDAGWAVRMGFTECCYGQVELEESLWAESQKIWEESFKERPNPFLASSSLEPDNS